MGIIINQSLIKEVTTANFALEKSALEVQKTKEEILKTINEMDQQASEITKYIEIKTNAWIKNTIVTKDEIVKSQNSFIETNMAIKNTMPTSTIVVRILGEIAIV